ncbi:hypothetical protein [Reichenbachiella sp.]|uniref:hypothetical protein n=1 Tax=Reichenbachiella sp. TaxID=2184521 RepID=UPI003B5CE05C
MGVTFEQVLSDLESAKAEISTILEVIQDAKDNDAELDGLNAVSVKADFKLWQNVFASVSYIVDLSLNERIDELDEFSAQRQAISAAWLDKILREYQEGDTLEIDPDTGLPYYAVIDEDKQIIKRVAIIQGNGTYTAKVAGEDSSGNAVPFSSAQITSILAYLDTYILGNHGTPESRDADLLKAEYNVYFNAIKSESVVRPLVEAAIEEYLRTLKTFDFGGILYLSKIEDAIQSVADVVDFERINIEARTSVGTFQSVARSYTPAAGYMDIDPATPLSSTLNFIAV